MPYATFHIQSASAAYHSKLGTCIRDVARSRICWQAISTGSGAGTPPPVHTATAPTRRQSTWCSGVQLMTRPEETSGWEDYSTRTHDAHGSSWSGLGRMGGDPPPPALTGNERERESRSRMKVPDVRRNLVPDTWTADVEGALMLLCFHFLCVSRGQLI